MITGKKVVLNGANEATDVTYPITPEITPLRQRQVVKSEAINSVVRGWLQEIAFGDFTHPSAVETGDYIVVDVSDNKDKESV